jgi:hypothetical protein
MLILLRSNILLRKVYDLELCIALSIRVSDSFVAAEMDAAEFNMIWN